MRSTIHDERENVVHTNNHIEKYLCYQSFIFVFISEIKLYTGQRHYSCSKLGKINSRPQHIGS